MLFTCPQNVDYFSAFLSASPRRKSNKSEGIMFLEFRNTIFFFFWILNKAQPLQIKGEQSSLVPGKKLIHSKERCNQNPISYTSLHLGCINTCLGCINT